MTSLALVLESGGDKTANGPRPNNYPSRLRAGSALTLLILACLIAYIDWQIFALLVTPVKAALRLSDTRIGTLQGLALNLTMGLAAFPLGIVIDRRNRMKFLMFASLGWSGFTALSGVCTGFWQILFCRIGVGVAEGGLYSTAFSLIADLYEPRHRANATFVFFAGILLAASMSAFLSGGIIRFITAHAGQLPWHLAALAPWRLTFLAAATPGLAIALLFLIAPEPRRQVEDAHDCGDANQIVLKDFLRHNAAAVFGISGSMFAAQIAFQALLFWMPTIMSRIYQTPADVAAEIFGLVWGVGSILGVVISAALIRFLRVRTGHLAPFHVFNIGIAAPALILPLLLLKGSLWQVTAFWLMHTVTTYIAIPIGPTLITSITPQHLRGRLFAIYNLTGVLSSAVASQFVGILSDYWSSNPRGLLLSCCALGIPASLVAPMLFLFVRRSFRGAELSHSSDAEEKSSRLVSK